MEVYDGRSGEALDPELVKKSRKEELGFMKKIDLYEEAPIEECWGRTGKPPVDTKWVDANKGTKERPDVRCRMVARDFKPKGEKDREDLFAAMPPLEAKKLLFKKAAMGKREWRNGRWARQKLMFIDVKKAHLNGVVGEDDHVYISVPPGVCPPGRCWKLKRWLYGMRPAASAWESDYSEKLDEFGMKKGCAVPTAFFDESRDMRCVAWRRLYVSGLGGGPGGRGEVPGEGPRRLGRRTRRHGVDCHPQSTPDVEGERHEVRGRREAC